MLVQTVVTDIIPISSVNGMSGSFQGALPLWTQCFSTLPYEADFLVTITFLNSSVFSNTSVALAVFNTSSPLVTVNCSMLNTGYSESIVYSMGMNGDSKLSSLFEIDSFNPVSPCSYSIVFFSCGSIFPPFNYSVQLFSPWNDTALALTNCSSLNASAVITPHESVSIVRLALVLVFGGLIWLGSVIYAIKKLLLHNKYFYFLNDVADFMSTAANVVTLQLEKRVSECDADEEVDDVEKMYRDVANFDALPPKLSAIIGVLAVVVLTGIWVSAILATLLVHNWPSYVGTGMLVILIIYFGVWLLVKHESDVHAKNAIEGGKQIAEYDHIRAEIMADVEAARLAQKKPPRKQLSSQHNPESDTESKAKEKLNVSVEMTPVTFPSEIEPANDNLL